MKGWSTYLLGEAPLEIIDGDRGKNYPSEGELLENGDCLFLSTKNVRKHGFDFTSCQFITSEKDRLLRKGKLKINDLVLTTRGTVGNIALYNDNKYDNVRINSGMVIIRPHIEKIYPTYLFYTFIFLQREWNLVVSGSAQPQLPIKDIKNIQISIPPMAEQRAITTVLSNLDDKIDLLHRQNDTLEAMAEALFRQWFVVEAKEDWEEKTLGDFFPITTGKKNSNYSTEDGKFPFFTCSKKVLLAPSYSFDGAAILLSGNGYFDVKRYNGKFEAYQRTYVLIPDDARFYNFLYIAIKMFLNDITQDYRGSVINFITKGMIENFPLLMPRENIDNKLQRIDIIFSRIDANVSQIRTLEKLRDTLLPKLMSGEVRVSLD